MADIEMLSGVALLEDLPEEGLTSPRSGWRRCLNLTACFRWDRVQKNEEVILSVVSQQDRSTNDPGGCEPRLSILVETVLVVLFEESEKTGNGEIEFLS